MSDERRHVPDALSDAILAVASELSVKPILQKLVEAARDLVRARYAAIGVPDDEGGFAEFITAGMTDGQIEAIGPLPRSHGMLDAVLQSKTSLRLPNLQDDDRYAGWWPEAHPDMRSLLGVPIVSKGSVIGAFYLTNKKDAPGFSERDQELIERFAAHAAVALDNARLFEQSRELTVVEERNRLARDLHDSVTQTLFSTVLTAQAASELLERDPSTAKVELDRALELAKSALTEMRSVVFELRPADIGSEGLVETLRKHIEIVRRVFGTDVRLDVEGDCSLESSLEVGLYRILQEALSNALKHAHAEHVIVRMNVDDSRVVATVTDDGEGFDPKALPVRAKHLGLTSMEERAEDLGGKLRIESSAGVGTTVTVEVPR